MEEIRLRDTEGPGARAQPDDSPTAYIQATLQDNVDKGSLMIHVHETDPYNDINPTGEYTLRRDDSKGTTKAYDPGGSWLGEMTDHRLSELHSRFQQASWRPENEASRAIRT